MRRLEYEAGAWHVIARGARRLELFRDDQDFLTFLSILRYGLAISGAKLWAFALMSNHYHLVIYASSKELTACMLRVNRTYSRYHNRRYGLVGHAFDGPYKAFRQGVPLLLLRTIAYVFMNPAVPGMVAAPEDYRWSCVRDYLALPGSPLRVNPGEVMNWISKDASAAWSAFHRAMDREARRSRPFPGTSLTRVQVHAQQFEWLLEHAKESEHLFPGEDPVLVAMYWAKQSGIAPRAMASVLGLVPKQVCNLLTRFIASLQSDPDRAGRLALG